MRLLSGLFWLMPSLLTAQIDETDFQSGITPSSAGSLPTAKNASIFDGAKSPSSCYPIVPFRPIPITYRRQAILIGTTLWTVSLAQASVFTRFVLLRGSPQFSPFFKNYLFLNPAIKADNKLSLYG